MNTQPDNKSEYAFVHLARLCGCNYKVAIERRGKSVYVPDPQFPAKQYRISAADFDAGKHQFRSSWCIERWSDHSQRTMDSERNWMD